eukprot:TRINITY_DN16033_c0_g1_i2.p1 TRINITY_DN16033_c0_g1~~TRINITY_DN16033_c0_g1_i2.p1  ORF type:complete len:114 (+),score=14.32 TRINITY_DN16033_c0_g1_i2:304-645(+)
MSWGNLHSISSSALLFQRLICSRFLRGWNFMIAELFCQLLLFNTIILTNKKILHDHVMEDHAAISHRHDISPQNEVCWGSELQQSDTAAHQSPSQRPFTASWAFVNTLCPSSA